MKTNSSPLTFSRSTGVCASMPSGPLSTAARAPFFGHLPRHGPHPGNALAAAAQATRRPRAAAVPPRAGAGRERASAGIALRRRARKGQF